LEPPPAAAAAAVELPLRAQHAATDEPCLQVADAALHKVCTCLSPLAKNDTRFATSPQVHCSGMQTESCAAPKWLRGSTCLSVQCSAARSTGRPPTAGRARAQAPLPWPAAGHRAHLGPAFLHQSHVVYSVLRRRSNTTEKSTRRHGTLKEKIFITCLRQPPRRP